MSTSDVDEEGGFEPEKLGGSEATRPKTASRKKGEFCGYPSNIFFILGNEFCERFSFYGFRAVLVLYLTCFLGFSDETATEINHVFVALAYIFPVVGAIISDSYWGKYRTILYLSLVYTVGEGLIAMTAIPGVMAQGRTIFSSSECPSGSVFETLAVDNTTSTLCRSSGGVVCPSGFTVSASGAVCVPNASQAWGTLLGLLLIAIGTGGIKPCVSTFGGDQFSSSQADKLATFFSIFYFAINSGSTISTIFTPVLRKMGCPDCGTEVISANACSFAMAFAVPAILMLAATGLFVVGKKTVGYRDVPPEGSNVIVKVAKVTFCAIRNRKARPVGGHWLDAAVSRFDQQVIDDIKALFAIVYVFVPLPLFWALFDQQSSTWTLQARPMSGELGALTLEPDQMSALNPILIVILLPVFENLIYPCVTRIRGHKPAPLARMGVGIFFSAISFFLAAFLQMWANAECRQWSTDDASLCLNSPVNRIWQFPQYFIVTAGEVMFSITGLEFAYSQAPVSMKAVVTSAWLISVALGNLLVVAVTAISQAIGLHLLEQFFFYAFLCLAALMLFVAFSWKYTYVDNLQSDTDKEKNSDTLLLNEEDDL